MSDMDDLMRFSFLVGEDDFFYDLLETCVILIFILIGLTQALPDFKGAEALMQIQRVLDLSAEIAKAEEVTVSDISTSESKYTEKRQYAVPEDLLRLVGNTITDLKSQQASAASAAAADLNSNGHSTYVPPGIQVQSEDDGNYAIIPYSSQQQREEQQEQQQQQQQSSSNQGEPTQQYILQESPIQYILPQGQVNQYALSQDELKQYALQPGQGQQYSLPQSQGQQYTAQTSQGQQNTLQSSQGQQYTLEPNQGQQYTLQYEQGQQYTIQPESAQQYASQPESAQKYASQPEQSQQHAPPQSQQQYSLPQFLQYQLEKQPAAYNQVPVADSYVATFSGPSPPVSPHLAEVAQVVSSQQQSYPTAQSLAAYQADPHHHYAIAAQQAQTVTHQKPQQHMYYLGGHPQTGTYTEAVIHGGNPSGQYVPEPASQLTVPKAPVQINIHPQAYNSNRNSLPGGQSSYMPLQILINHLAEPAKYAQPGISAPGGPDQPKSPIYHYSPVPAGTIKDEHVPEMRIKSAHNPPNPHSDKYKDYQSSPPVSSSLAMPPASSFSMSQASHQPESPSPQPTKSPQPDWDDDEFVKYDFGYRVSDENHKLEFGKTESKKDGVTKGSYHVLLPDGRLQVVKYWSDHTGYHTDISYKVPGVDGKK